MHAQIRAIGLQLARIHVVSQIRLQHFVFQIRTKMRILDRTENLDSTIEIAIHPAGAAYVNLRRAGILEIEDAAVLEKATDDAPHANILRQSVHAGTEHADAANNQIDRDADL